MKRGGSEMNSAFKILVKKDTSMNCLHVTKKALDDKESMMMIDEDGIHYLEHGSEEMRNGFILGKSVA